MLPLVSVRVVTYNHEKYIAQCLEGILMQRANFPFEVVVGEDCSTDHTREIVLAYGQKYPEILRVITSENNVGGVRNSMRVQRACRGKYHASCEGDDYWIDPLKLQKQVDLMEADADISLCFHNAFIVNEPAAVTRLYFASPVKERLTFAEACQMNIPTASVMARSEILATLPEWRLNIWSGDVLVRLWCAHHGNLGYLNEVMSVYRIHSGGMVAMLRSSPEKRYAKAMYLYREFDKETHYQHTASIQARAQEVEHKFQRRRLGWFYFLLHPGKIIARLKEYYALVDKQRKLFG